MEREEEGVEGGGVEEEFARDERECVGEADERGEGEV